MSDARLYAVRPDPRSRSRALQSWKSGHFYKLSPLPFRMGAGNGPLIPKLGTITKFYQAGFSILGLVFMSHDYEVGRNVSCEESTVSPVPG